MPIPINIKINKAGNPPKFDSMRIPSIPARSTMVIAKRPTNKPQITLRKTGDSWSLAVISLQEILLIALVAESAAVTKDKYANMRKKIIHAEENGKFPNIA